jgi:hypothetical protein
LIYEKLFNTESMANNPTEEAKHANALLATCSQIFSEALPEFNKFGEAHVKAMRREWDTIRQKNWETKRISIMFAPEKLNWYVQARSLSIRIGKWRTILKDLQALEEHEWTRRMAAKLIESFN